jgi:hypothetical protein
MSSDAEMSCLRCEVSEGTKAGSTEIQSLIEPGVLQRNGCLVSEGCGHLHILRGEALFAAGPNTEHTCHPLPNLHGHAQEGAVAKVQSRLPMAREETSILSEIIHQQGLARRRQDGRRRAVGRPGQRSRGAQT